MPKGVIPTKPYAEDRTISAKVSPEFVKRLKQVALDKDTSVSVIIKTAVFNYMAGAQVGR